MIRCQIIKLRQTSTMIESSDCFTTDGSPTHHRSKAVTTLLRLVLTDGFHRISWCGYGRRCWLWSQRRRCCCQVLVRWWWRAVGATACIRGAKLERLQPATAGGLRRLHCSVLAQPSGACCFRRRVGGCLAGCLRSCVAGCVLSDSLPAGCGSVQKVDLVAMLNAFAGEHGVNIRALKVGVV